MNSLLQQLQQVNDDISHYCQRYHRQPTDVTLLAVSKTRSADEIRQVYQHGQQHFGESYLQEAVDKITQLKDTDIEWHFIGRIQSNKTKLIAQHFSWVHSLGSLKHAAHLNRHREGSKPLNCCIQINIDHETSKGGIQADQIDDYLEQISSMKNLQLRGFMCIPSATQHMEQQKAAFHHMQLIFNRTRTQYPNLDTLSMGMSGDMEAAIAEGAHIIRIGTAIFGPRHYP